MSCDIVGNNYIHPTNKQGAIVIFDFIRRVNINAAAVVGFIA